MTQALIKQERENFMPNLYFRMRDACDSSDKEVFENPKQKQLPYLFYSSNLVPNNFFYSQHLIKEYVLTQRKEESHKQMDKNYPKHFLCRRTKKFKLLTNLNINKIYAIILRNYKLFK